ncbi:MAG: serine hydrolase [Chloroflexi bacterium]|nr:serine hydrolase [Chloroflexota bacterium]
MRNKDSCKWSSTMKQKTFFVLMISIIIALPLLTYALFGPPRLVVKPEAASNLNKLLAQWTRDGTFTGSVLIAQDGVVFLSEGYGLANRERGIPNTPGTRFHLCSLSKQFTAMAILILQSQGKLNVQDPICDYITNCTAAWKDITIHQLLTHTAGLSPELYDIVVDAASDPEAPPDPAYYIKIAGEVPLETRPGEQYAYNNHGGPILCRLPPGEHLHTAEYARLRIRRQFEWKSSGLYRSLRHDRGGGVAAMAHLQWRRLAVLYHRRYAPLGPGSLYRSAHAPG